MTHAQEYKQKLVSAEEAVKCVKSGDDVEYSHFVAAPTYLDGFLAKRKDELKGVIVNCCTFPGLAQVAVCDPERDHFIYNNWHLSGGDRKLAEQGLCNYIPFLYHEMNDLYERHFEPDVFMVKVCPMDKDGYFNMGTSNSGQMSIAEKSKKIIVEVNNTMPYVYGGYGESIHIDKVDYIVESDNKPLMEVQPVEPNDADKTVANLIVNMLEDGSVIQLGIGGMPNAVGALLATSDLKNLGGHTEMLVDAYMLMIQAGVMNNRDKPFNRGRIPYTFSMGTKALYEWMDHNPMIASFPVGYCNSPYVLAQIDKLVSINNTIEIDLFGQAASESNGYRQITGTGGQFDYHFAAFKSKGGKGILCLRSTFTGKDGVMKSRIVPTLSPGTIVTTPRTVTQYVVTEYGAVNLKGKNTWQRAEALISVAHPDFRDALIKEAEKMKIWVAASKRV
ncbi:MAG: 4-hydroxybutyrate CoA-transferase [Desulfobulbaceae bacterium]|nr:4-hydroxybutyrate CoA-transferase [Desulfobulbaceae bacterium]